MNKCGLVSALAFAFSILQVKEGIPDQTLIASTVHKFKLDAPLACRS